MGELALVELSLRLARGYVCFHSELDVELTLSQPSKANVCFHSEVDFDLILTCAGAVSQAPRRGLQRCVRRKSGNTGDGMESSERGLSKRWRGVSGQSQKPGDGTNKVPTELNNRELALIHLSLSSEPLASKANLWAPLQISILGWHSPGGFTSISRED